MTWFQTMVETRIGSAQKGDEGRSRGVEKGQEWYFSLSLLWFLSLLQLQARSQLRLAGLFPSAYWCGQALVDIPFFWSLLCLMFGLLVLFTRICPLETRAVLSLVSSGHFSAGFGFEEFICKKNKQVCRFSYIRRHLLVTDVSLSLSLQLVCIFGYGISLVLFVYLMAFKFRTGRSNRYIWSLAFILVSEEHLHSEMFDSHTLPLGALFQICINLFQFVSVFSRITWVVDK